MSSSKKEPLKMRGFLDIRWDLCVGTWYGLCSRYHEGEYTSYWRFCPDKVLTLDCEASKELIEIPYADAIQEVKTYGGEKDLWLDLKRLLAMMDKGIPLKIWKQYGRDEKRIRIIEDFYRRFREKLEMFQKTKRESEEFVIAIPDFSVMAMFQKGEAGCTTNPKGEEPIAASGT